MMSPKVCQCENKAHFGNDPGVHRFEEVPATKVVQTPFGRFNVCQRCIASRHMDSEVLEDVDNRPGEVPL